MDIRFPTAGIVGVLYTRAKGVSPLSNWDWDGNWGRIAFACGSIEIDPEKEVLLAINADASDASELLIDVPPGSITALRLFGSRIDLRLLNAPFMDDLQALAIIGRGASSDVLTAVARLPRLDTLSICDHSRIPSLCLGVLNEFSEARRLRSLDVTNVRAEAINLRLPRSLRELKLTISGTDLRASSQSAARNAFLKGDQLQQLTVVGRLPRSFFENLATPLLESLDVGSSHVTCRAVRTWSQMGSLRSVSLVHADLDREASLGLADLSSVHYLELPSTASPVGLGSVGRMHALRSLAVFGEPETVDINELADVPSLERLEIPNALLSPSCSRLGELKALRGLDISGTAIDDSTLESVSQLLALEYLNLDACAGIGHRGLQMLSRLHGLRVLTIADSEAIPCNLEFLRPLMSLTRVNLSGLKLTGAAPPLPRLEELTAGRANLEKQVLSSFSRLDGLQRLSLRWTPLPSEEIATLGRLKRLESIWIQIDGNEDVDWLRRLPNLRCLGILSCTVDERILRILSDCPVLSSLALQKCSIQSSTVNTRWPAQLTCLSLRQSSIGGTGILQSISRIGTLRNLELSETEANASELAALDGTSIRRLSVQGIPGAAQQLLSIRLPALEYLEGVQQNEIDVSALRRAFRYCWNLFDKPS